MSGLEGALGFVRFPSPLPTPFIVHMVKKGPAQGHVLSEWQCQALTLPKPVLSLHGDAVLR